MLQRKWVKSQVGTAAIILWKVLSKLALLAPKLLLTSGGGYNPWSVSRLWTGFWAILNDIELPSLYTDEGRRLIENLRWFRKDKVNPNLLSSLKDEQICYGIKQETLNLIKRMNVIHKSSIQMIWYNPNLIENIFLIILVCLNVL